MGIAAVSFKCNNGIEILIYPQGKWDTIDFSVATEEKGTNMIAYGEKEAVSKNMLSKLDIATSVDGRKILRLRETVTYICRLKGNIPADLDQICKKIGFPNENNKFLKVNKDRDTLSFRYINYLGRTHLKNYLDETVVDFEIVPQKMNYEEDYIDLTKRLSEECAEILLEYSGITTNKFDISDTNSVKTLLEQFIFLREFCYSHNLRALFGHIKRNPDSMLMKDEVFKPIGQGAPSASYYSSPFSHGTGWQIVNGKPMPQKVSVTRKYDSLDTVANRFVKFALKKFNMICRELCSDLDEKRKKAGQNMYAECYREAFEIQRITDDILRDRFFDDVRELTIMPQNNQVLEKREGYRQIFKATAMIDLALQLNWEGEQEVYNGESKNTALLYEYWLFFELRKIIGSIENCQYIKDCENPFINTDNGLTISLSEGQTSCQAFLFPDLGIKVNLYYNRTFSWEEFSNTKYAGSYSRPFRPDYTLEIYPSNFVKPEDAAREGAVRFVHFDAKYRITEHRAFNGQDVNKMTTEQIKEEVEEDKQDSVANIYKRGDLLKMHTYNDAIRRTVGSYILYPGDFDPKTRNYMLFDEVLPGVGAFAIKPSIQEDSENVLKNFIYEIIETLSKKYSRLNRMLSYSNLVLGEPTISALDKRVAGAEKDNKNIHNNLCIIGYLKPDYYKMLSREGLLSEGKAFVFYYNAIKGEFLYSHHKDIGKAKYIRFYQNDISVKGEYEIEPFKGVIKSRGFVSKKQLNDLLTKNGCNDGKERFADFYYVLKVEIISCKELKIICKNSDLNDVNGNDTFSPHSPKVVNEYWFNFYK